MKNTFQSKKNLVWFPRKCFPFILNGKHFSEDVKNLEISYYLLFILNLILKFLINIYIYIYILLNNFFLILSLIIFTPPLTSSDEMHGLLGESKDTKR
jgi:hypothetical protein